MKRRILWTFLISGVLGWAVAHFTVGNAGAIALRAAVSEGRMRFSSAEQRSAASRLASLKGKSAQEQAAIIAGWWEITSVSELRHLYSLLREVPREFQDEARAILLGRWAMLEPDSLLLQATREGTAGKIAVMQAFSRHWAAGLAAARPVLMGPGVRELSRGGAWSGGGRDRGSASGRGLCARGFPRRGLRARRWSR